MGDSGLLQHLRRPRHILDRDVQPFGAFRRVRRGGQQAQFTAADLDANLSVRLR